ncbi:MAG: exodeoxyribonuclease VII large subunit [Coriobacteriia bacterium]
MSESHAITVTEAMLAAKTALEGVRARVVGEVSEISDKPGYRAAYFTLSDGNTAMPCLMWRDAYEMSGIELRCGMLVEVSGSFSAYIAKGRMQFQVRSLLLAGEGDLRVKVAALARKLEAEGLMRPERKRALPRYPQRIAVVTSPRGKAVHDVLRTLRRRYPFAEVLVAGVTVEGAAAADEIVSGLQAASRCGADAILLVRGGGSYEDLMPFNAEQVARAVAACSVPVVTGIGHEPDTCIADMVADLRASTPTAAAEAVAPSKTTLDGAIARERRALANALKHRLSIARRDVSRLAERPVMRDPVALLAPVAQTIDLMEMRLARAIPERFSRDSLRLAHVRERLDFLGLRLLDRPSSRVMTAAARLEALSPLAVLSRGYAVCFAEDGRTVVREVKQVAPGDVVHVRVSDGRVNATVTDTQDMEELEL